MPRERIVSLQILRFVAAAMVVVAHASIAAHDTLNTQGAIARSALEWLARVGFGGVDIFFVLSGMVIMLTGPLAQPRPNASRFALRRFVRVIPVFWLWSLVAVVAAQQPLTWPQTAATLFAPFASGDPVLPYLKQGWTLAFEVTFYAAVALVMIGGRLRRNLVVAAVAVAVLAGLRILAPDALTRFLINPLFLYFAAGAVMARALPALSASSLRFGALLLGTAILWLGLAGLPGVGHYVWGADALAGNSWPRLAMFGVPAVCLVAGCVVVERLCVGRLAHWAAWMGDASYSIYLVHTLAISALVWLFKIGGPAGAPAFLALAIPLALAAGAIAHAYVERPILRELRRLKLPAAWRPARSGAIGT